MNHSIMFATVLALGTISDILASPLVTNAGFEDVQPIINGVTDYGMWWGNIAQMVTAENGVTPTEGLHMVKYLETSSTSNLRQLVDTSSLANRSEVTLSADVFRITGTPSNAEFRLAFAAMDHGPPSSNGDFDTHTIGVSLYSVPSNVWTNIAFSTIIPPGTVMLAVEVSYTSRGDLGGYADNVQLTPEPSSFGLAAMSLVGLVAWWRRRKQ